MIKERLSNAYQCMKRKKKIQFDESNTLKRCLTLFDLTFLGIGNMTGSGIYVLTGSVMTQKAGPATFLSYLLAGIAAFLNALTYAELCSKMPKSGSAYLYTYVAGGEFLAFTIGWAIILEYVLSVASVAKGWSGTIDTLVMGKISNGSMEVFGSFPTQYGLSAYPDFISVGIIALFVAIIAFGPKISVVFNSSITIINILIILIASGVMLSHPMYPFSFAPSSKGGFMPFGFSGVLAGSGTCFYSFIGFDAVTISSEEALNPSKTIPLANGLSVSFVTMLFVLSSAALPMFIHWYQVDPRAAFTSAFKFRGLNWAAYITGVGSLLGISASLFTSIYALPRLVYSMADDGLLFAPLKYVSSSSQVPIVALIVFSMLAALLSFFLDIHTLADFLSIGTLIAYTLASVVLLILRFNLIGKELADQTIAHHHKIEAGDDEEKIAEITEKAETNEIDDFKFGNLKDSFRKYLPRFMENESAPNIIVITFIILTGLLFCLIFKGFYYVSNMYAWAWFFLVIMLVLLIGCVVLLYGYKQFETFNTFQVPYVPFTPLLTIMLNITLIINLSWVTWARLFVWLFIGFLIYFFYGIKHSKLHEGFGGKIPLVDTTNSDIAYEAIDK